MAEQPNSDSHIHFLSVGTQNLLTDTMDQYVRTLGSIRTHFASSMSSAMRFFQDGMVHILMMEVDLDDGSAYRLVKSLGGSTIDDSLYMVLALEDETPELKALAEEMEVHQIVKKPFTAADLKSLIDSYKVWRATPKDKWLTLIREAQFSAREKKFREAEKNFLEACKAAPLNPAPVYKSGLYYLTKPDYNMAEKLLKRAIEMKENYAAAISTLGSLYLVKGDLGKAEEYLVRAHSISPKNPDRAVEMTRLYIDRAMESCKNALRLDPSAVSARSMLGKLLAVQKDYVGAVRELERSLPDLRDAIRSEAQTFIALSRKLGSLAK
ncbi:MAG: tetratricopeptide repeat protein [Bacteriovoracia bacterium]